TTLVQLAQGLTAIHRAGKLHRDLKPSNVRVTPEGRVVILDFGISADVVLRDSPVHTIEEGVWGTPEYMSPEQAEKQAIPASDSGQRGDRRRLHISPSPLLIRR